MSNALLRQTNLHESEISSDGVKLYLGDRNQPGGMDSERRPAALYLRVSTDDQDVGMQETYCRSMALMDGFSDEDIIIYSDEGKSATKMPDLRNRPAGNRMIQDIEAGKITHVYAYRVDRLFRSNKGGADFVDECVKKWPHLSLRTSEAPVDLTSGDGEFLFGLSVLLARREAAILSVRTRGGMQHTAENLNKVSRDVWGWKVASEKTKDAKATMEPHWKQQAILEWVLVQTDSNNKVARRLNDLGIKTVSGKKFSGTTIWRMKNQPPKFQDQLHQFGRPKRMISYPFRTYKA